MRIGKRRKKNKKCKHTEVKFDLHPASHLLNFKIYFPLPLGEHAEQCRSTPQGAASPEWDSVPRFVRPEPEGRRYHNNFCNDKM
jgi:hypothetical protein